MNPEKLDFEAVSKPTLSDLERLEFTEAFAMIRFVIDIIIRLISVLLPLSLGLTTFGFTTAKWELFVTSSAVLVILALIIWRTYRLVNGLLLSVIIAEKRYFSLPEAGLVHLFISIALSPSYQKRLKAYTSTVYPHHPVQNVRALPPAHIGTPRWLIYGGLFVLFVFNLAMAYYYFDKPAHTHPPSAIPSAPTLSPQRSSGHHATLVTGDGVAGPRSRVETSITVLSGREGSVALLRK